MHASPHAPILQAGGLSHSGSTPPAPGAPPAIPPAAPPPSFTANPLEYLVALTATPSGEIALCAAVTKTGLPKQSWLLDLKTVWIDAVKRGDALSGAEKSAPENAPYAALAARPLVQHIRSMAHDVITPRPDNFTPPERTPWGGTQIPKLKKSLGIVTKGVVGESWEISGHPSFPNMIPTQYAGHTIDIPLWLIGHFAPLGLYGPDNVGRFGDEPPFLTKLLNSGSWQSYKKILRPILDELNEHPEAHAWQAALGVTSLGEMITANNHDLHHGIMYLHQAIMSVKMSDSIVELATLMHDIHRAMIAHNLSIQIHPDARYAEKTPSWHSKTEMWVILDTEPGAGLYLGLKDGITESQMRRALEENLDISTFLNFIEVKPGEVFFIPAGTPHAIGAGVMLLEQQETSETTFRYFSWWDGRELHVEDAVACTHWDAPRGTACIDSMLRRTPRHIGSGAGAHHELLAAEEEFSFDRVLFSGGSVHTDDASSGMHGITVTQGSVMLTTNDATHGPFSAGQSFIIPASLGSYALRAPAETGATMYIGRSDTRAIT